ncbi:hypothetical protein RBA41_01055 [Massilia sp. CCM 9210]|uniref:hypothetical protein n=1 Tax=Massilia scottii TaxID=3057166 RepID=UPI002796423C|nr:hypothetical protein [Massilia sp. CCM 9210]MDQ1811882.1 hypothetical protein [Massilia sp. CCM 9210]
MPISLDRPISLPATKPPPFVFFPTVRAHSFWRYFWPFQSVKQFMLTIAESLVAAIICILLAPQSTRPDARAFLAVGFLLAVLRKNGCEALPSKITIASTRGPARQLMPMIEQIFVEREYTRAPLPASGDHIHFLPPLAAGPSWFYSPEQDIELAVVYDNIIEVRGPKNTLYSIEMFLRWKLEE